MKVEWVHFPLHPETPAEGRSLADLFAGRNVDRSAMHAQMKARMEAVLVLATIAQRFRLSLVPGQRITPTPYVTLRPEPGIRMLVARR